MTEDNLKAAFAGESQAHMRYMIFADKAETEKRPNIARLFRAIAYAERVHATNHYKALAAVRATPDKLGVAIEGETYEVEEMYPAFNAVARLQDEKKAVQSTDWALQAEKVHAKLYYDAQLFAQRGQDSTVGSVYVCDLCGYTGEGEPPEVCPVCGAKREKGIFRTF